MPLLQYNQGGVGVAVTNEGYAQLVSVFTICCNGQLQFTKEVRQTLQIVIVVLEHLVLLLMVSVINNLQVLLCFSGAAGTRQYCNQCWCSNHQTI